MKFDYNEIIHVDINSPPHNSFVGISSFFSFCTTVIPLFLGTTKIGLIHTLSEIGLMIPTSESFNISALTTSFIFGLNVLWLSILGGKLSSISMQSVGLIHLMSTIDHPINVLFYLSTLSNLSFLCSLIEFEIMIGNVEDSS